MRKLHFGDKSFVFCLTPLTLEQFINKLRDFNEPFSLYHAGKLMVDGTDNGGLIYYNWFTFNSYRETHVPRFVMTYKENDRWVYRLDLTFRKDDNDWLLREPALV